MPSHLYSIVVDARDPSALARFWAAVLDYRISCEEPDEVEIVADEQTAPGLVFVPVPDDKQVKNRLHIDLNPDDQQAEVDRVIGLGARRVEVGQSRASDVTWVVLADPEGNEFCILSARPQPGVPT
jgi:predicted enzyme related to lactoylglutathione lyase